MRGPGSPSGSLNKSSGPSTRRASGGRSSPARARCAGQSQGDPHPPLVTLLRGGVTDGPVDAPRAHRFEDRLPPGLAELLGVPEPPRHAALGGFGRDQRDPDTDRAGPRTAADLVHAGDPGMTIGAEGPLFREIRLGDVGSGHPVIGVSPASIRWGREHWGGGTRSERAVPPSAGDPGGRPQPLSGHLDARIRGGRVHRGRLSHPPSLRRQHSRRALRSGRCPPPTEPAGLLVALTGVSPRTRCGLLRCSRRSGWRPASGS